MPPTSSDYEALAEELKEAEVALCFAQWRYHLAEAKKIELKLAEKHMRPSAIGAGAKPTEARKQGTSRTKDEKRNTRRSRASARRRFFMEGPTTVIVRLLHENRGGMTNFEIQARNGIAIKGRVIRKIINRLMAAGCAVRQGNKVVLTETGIAAWEASPLFLRSSRNNRGQAA